MIIMAFVFQKLLILLTNQTSLESERLLLIHTIHEICVFLELPQEIKIPSNADCSNQAYAISQAFEIQLHSNHPLYFDRISESAEWAGSLRAHCGLDCSVQELPDS